MRRLGQSRITNCRPDLETRIDGGKVRRRLGSRRQGPVAALGKLLGIKNSVAHALDESGLLKPKPFAEEKIVRGVIAGAVERIG